MTILSALLNSLSRALAWTSAIVLVLLLAYSQYNIRSLETSAAKLVVDHVQRLSESNALESSQLSIQRDISRFGQSVSEALGIEAQLTVTIDGTLVASVGESNGERWFTRNVSVSEILPSGSRLSIDGTLNFSRQYRELILLSLIVLVLVNVGLWAAHRFMKRSAKAITTPMSEISSWLDSVAQHLPESLESAAPPRSSAVREVAQIASSSEMFLEKLRHFYAQQEESLRLRSRFEIAAQVSHDIRSPISAINMVIATLSEIPEDKRMVLQQAVRRINGIAADLLERPKPAAAVGGGGTEQSEGQTGVKLADILNAIVSEKRASFANSGTKLVLDLTGPSDAVCEVNETELSRVVSNLINNAYEALEDKGTVTVALRSANKDLALVIGDDGKGMPEEVLAKIGREKVSYGKEGSTTSGSGLGLFHAKQAVERMNGKFSIQSRQGMGTLVTIKLPRISPPA